MRCLATLLAIVVAVLLLPAVCAAQAGPGSLVIIGAGWVGDWDTEIELADAPAAGGTTGSIEKFVITLQPCAQCGTSFAIPENGAVRFLASEILGDNFSDPQLLRVTTNGDAPLPITRARVFRRSLPCQSADLPVLRESTLRSAYTGVLVFPGLHRDPATHSNLILQGVGDPILPVDVRIDAFAPDGTLIGSTTATIPPEAASPALTFVDVVALLGGDQVEGGSLVVTSLRDPNALVWGVLATYAADGALTMTGGLNP
jgi:hypothetical protein